VIQPLPCRHKPDSTFALAITVPPTGITEGAGSPRPSITSPAPAGELPDEMQLLWRERRHDLGLRPERTPRHRLHTGTHSTYGATREARARHRIWSPRVHRGGPIRSLGGRRADRDHGWCNQFAGSLCLHPQDGRLITSLDALNMKMDAVGLPIEPSRLSKAATRFGSLAPHTQPTKPARLLTTGGSQPQPSATRFPASTGISAVRAPVLDSADSRARRLLRLVTSGEPGR
jgi:hypothetical protein